MFEGLEVQKGKREGQCLGEAYRELFDEMYGIEAGSWELGDVLSVGEEGESGVGDEGDYGGELWGLCSGGDGDGEWR